MNRAETESIKRALSADVGPEAAVAAARFADRADLEGIADVAYASFDSPFGAGCIAVTDRGIASVGLPNLSEERFLSQISRGLSPRVLEIPRRVDAARRELEQYFAGRRREFDLPIDWRLVRPGFYGRVLRTTAKLPFGVTSTYGEIAARSGNARAYRAAGTALGANPIPIVVPCHRVLRSGGAVGDYGGGPEMKRWLLELEGASGYRA